MLNILHKYNAKIQHDVVVSIIRLNAVIWENKSVEMLSCEAVTDFMLFAVECLDNEDLSHITRKVLKIICKVTGRTEDELMRK